MKPKTVSNLEEALQFPSWEASRDRPHDTVLPTQEYLESLRASIIQRGVDKAIIVHETRWIVDGWNRQMICKELGILWPRKVRKT